MWKRRRIEFGAEETEGRFGGITCRRDFSAKKLFRVRRVASERKSTNHAITTRVRYNQQDMSRSRTKKRTHSFVILSDDDNPAPVEKRLDPIIVLSDDDDPPPAKRSCPTVHKQKLSHNALRVTKEKRYVSVSDSSDEEENEDLIVAAKQAEILASIVQVGIDMAMRDAYIASKDQKYIFNSSPLGSPS